MDVPGFNYRVHKYENNIKQLSRLFKVSEIVIARRAHDLHLLSDEGQRQLLGLTRATLNQPPVLILDEATSNIDTRSELLIQQSLNELRKSRTTIRIAHRLSTIRDADEIIVLEHGATLYPETSWHITHQMKSSKEN